MERAQPSQAFSFLHFLTETFTGGPHLGAELHRQKQRTKPPKHGILRTYVKDGREYSLHATKGWKSRRLYFPEGRK